MDFASSFAYYDDNAVEDEVEISEADLDGSLLSNLEQKAAVVSADSRSSSSAAAPLSGRKEKEEAPKRQRAAPTMTAIAAAMQQQQQQQQQQAPVVAPGGPGAFGGLGGFGGGGGAGAAAAAADPFADLLAGPVAPQAPMPPPPADDWRKSRFKAAKPLFRRQVDTNVVAIRFGSLAQGAAEVFEGDPVFCKNCKVSFSSTSKLGKPKPKDKEEQAVPVPVMPQPQPPFRPPVYAAVMPASASASAVGGAVAAKVEEPPKQEKEKDADKEKDEKDNQGNQNWFCEFCGTENPVDLEPEELPTKESRDYVLEPGMKDDKEAKGLGAGDVIFVLDISGSMCVTTEVQGQFKLKGMKNPAEFDIPQLDGVPVPQQRNASVTYVSRLQCVQASIDAQLERWAKEMPEKRVGLITFNREVNIIGDGTAAEEVVAGDKLNSQSTLQDIGKKHQLEQSVKNTGKKLSEKLFGLSETGPTALGPALLIAVQMASHRAGSTVVVCTDGLANVGLGALDKKDEAEKEKVEQWYEGVGNVAKLAGVTVSVVSIKGDECALEDLGRVAEITGGSVERVDPLELTKNFSSILANPIIATNVTASFFLHEGLQFRNEDKATNKLTREIGNVTEDSEITFEYQFQDRAALEKYKNLPALPFQVQIHFTKLDGMKCLRVISKSQPLTNKREVAEKNVKMDLLAANVAQQGAKLAKKGDYKAARAQNLAWGKQMQQVARSEEQLDVFNNWRDGYNSFDQNLQVQQNRMESLSSGPPPAPPASAAPARGGFFSSLFGSASPAPASASAGSAAPAAPAAPSSSSASSFVSAKPMSKIAKSARSDQDYTEIQKFANVSSRAWKKDRK